MGFLVVGGGTWHLLGILFQISAPPSVSSKSQPPANGQVKSSYWNLELESLRGLHLSMDHRPSGLGDSINRRLMMWGRKFMVCVYEKGDKFRSIFRDK